ncbi:helicase-related protein [Anaeromicropila herbilytica]|uniref:Helicase C-terminal domain-containing protein n=2 Tax=Anaeromicropila herbilytica TaxID=2785025 RepID=A0A7R7EIV1_9FIRM|nr:helicase-related protein [Anaeromicropila herbilytica]BCN29510.1 hypothetical protein bsdtb5_08050 [Anaeromicropila herbilytica]
MKKIEYLKQLYQKEVEVFLEKPDEWKSFLEYAGYMYKYDFVTLVSAYAQNKDFTQLATYDAWKSIGRQVKRGENSIPVLVKSQHAIEHLFDVSQLYESKQTWIWQIQEEDREQYEKLFLEKNKQYVTEYIKTLPDIRSNMIVSEWKQYLRKENLKPEYRDALMTDFLYQSVDYMVQFRNNSVTEDSKHYFSKTYPEINSSTMDYLGYYIIKTGRKLLLNSKEIVQEIRKEKEHERRQKDRDVREWNGNGIRGEGRSLVRGSGRREERQSTTGQVRESGSRILGEREGVRTATTDPERSNDGNHVSDREESRGDDGDLAGRTSTERSNQEPKRYDGNLPSQTENSRPSRGNRTSRSDIQLELDLQALQQDIGNNEGVDKSSSPFLVRKSYGQKKVPDEIIEEMLQHGSGTVGGNQRIHEFFQNHSKREEQIDFLKKEYYYFGMGLARGNELGFHGMDSSPGKGIEIKWNDSKGKQTEILSWKQISAGISNLIRDGRYYISEDQNELSHNEIQKEEVEIPTIVDETHEDNNVHHVKIKQESDDKTDEIQDEKIDYQYEENHHLYDGGIKTKYQNNIAAIQLLKYLDKENRPATKEEQIILAKYVGWGGMAGAFDENSNTWSNEYQELKDILTPEEYKSARSSTNTAFYTPPEIIQGIYQALKQFGFDGGNILDPSMGNGNFFSVMPNQFREQSNLYGIELDSISGRIAKQLYQNATIQVAGYEEVDLPDNFFDVAIGNVPFGDYQVYDPKYKKHNFHIHDYFFAKTLDKVRAGGIIAFITSKGTLDKANPMVRTYLSERADLIGAIRLPNNTFQSIANTEVSSDIIFLQKRERLQVTKAPWIYTGYTKDKIPVNQYFIEHPDMLLGKMVFDVKRFGPESKYTTVIPKNPDTLLGEYEAAITKLSAQIKTEIDKEQEVEITSIPADPTVKNFCYTVVGDDIYYRNNSVMNQMNYTQSKSEQMKGLIQIRVAARTIINAQLENCEDEVLNQLQEQLHETYDSFLKKYGALSSKPNQIFKQDADYPLLLSLEQQGNDNEVKKADIFYKRTIKPYREITSVDTPREGLIVSLTEKGRVDIPYIAKLCGKDFKEVANALEGEIFINPEHYDESNPYQGYESSDEYLCGNVRKKLKIAKLYQSSNSIFQINIDALEKVQPKDLEASEIEVRLGATWIEEEDYNQFLYELLDTPKTFRKDPIMDHTNRKAVAIHYNSFDASFSVSNKTYSVTNRIRANETYGTSRMDAYHIVEDSLNLKTVVVKDRMTNADGNYYYVVNKKETILAREKQTLIKEKFKEWFWSDLTRREKYVTKYNDLFNNIRLREYDGSKLTFPGMNPDIELRKHQKDAIARVIYHGNALLAHCVGAGKTYEMIASAMEMKRIGLANKVMLCVPNHLTEQIGNDFMKLYPAANILIATKEDFEPLNRQTFISKIATGEYDGVIIGHSQFEKIPISKEREQEMIENQIEHARDAIERIKRENGENWSIKQMERFRKGLEVDLKKLRDTKRDQVIEFEELGIDALFVDEAHYYKNCAVFSKMRNVAGVSTSKAKKSMDMLMKCMYIQEINGGKGVVFATGTPVSNSMTELFVMQRYLQNQSLQEKGLHHFDAWAAQFGEVISSLELAPEGTGYRFKNRFAKFTNLPELMTMFREIADVQLPEMLQLPVPKLKGESYNIVVSEPSEYTKEVMKEFAQRAEEIRNGAVEPYIDNMLKITNEARLLGTDPRLLDPNAPNEANSKVNQCIENVYEEYIQSQSVLGTQIVFCDVGTPNANKKWSVYDSIKEELIKLGVPEEEICFIHDAKTEIQREKLFDELRAGSKRIIIGSTTKMGTGVNIQKRLIALHHLDCPWRPADIEQREGRILRQGNQNEEVSIYRYVTKNTFDSYSWQLVEQKQKFISQIMTNKSIERSCEDIDDTVLTYAEVKALATGNPLIREKMDIDTEVTRLKLLKNGFLNQKYKYELGIKKIYPNQIKEYQDKIQEVQKDMELRDANAIPEDSFKMVLMDHTYTERTEAGKALMVILSMEVLPKKLGEYRGFTMEAIDTETSNNYIQIKGIASHRLELGTSGLGNINRIENVLGNFEELLELYQDKLEMNQESLKEALINSKKEFPHEEELDNKLKRQTELNQILELDKKDEVLMDGEEQKEEKKAITPKEILHSLDRINESENDYENEME